MDHTHLTPYSGAPETLCGKDARVLPCTPALLDLEATKRKAAVCRTWACPECMRKHVELCEALAVMKAGPKPWTMAASHRAGELLTVAGSLMAMTRGARAERGWWIERMMGRDKRAQA